MHKSPHLDREWLYQKYVVEELSTYDIASIVKRDPKRIYEKLRDFDIPTRKRGHNLYGADNYMKHPGAVNPFQGKKHTSETRQRLSQKASVEKPYLRGSKNGMSGRIGTDNPNYKDGSSPERQRLYVSSEWKKILRTVYARDNYTCIRCGVGKKGKRGIHAHHIKTWAGNPECRFDISNLVTLCRSCHEWVHSAGNIDREFLS